MTNPVGRPRTTTADLPDDWKRTMIDCGQEGGSAVEVRCLLGIAQTAWETLLEDSEDFRITEKRRQALCQVWWERLGRKGASGEADINPTVWIFNMKNRFSWHDKQAIDHTTGGDKLPSPSLDTSKLSDAALKELMDARSRAESDRS